MTEPRDLAAIIEDLRGLNFRASRATGMTLSAFSLECTERGLAKLRRSHGTPEALQDARFLEEVAQRREVPSCAALCREVATPEAIACAAAYDAIAQELAAGPRLPDDDELWRRMRSGELSGQRTVRIIMEEAGHLRRRSKIGSSPERIIRNSARCMLCGDEIESVDPDEPISCRCRNLYVSGGLRSRDRVVIAGESTIRDTSIVEREDES